MPRFELLSALFFNLSTFPGLILGVSYPDSHFLQCWKQLSYQENLDTEYDLEKRDAGTVELPLPIFFSVVTRNNPALHSSAVQHVEMLGTLYVYASKGARAVPEIILSG